MATNKTKTQPESKMDIYEDKQIIKTETKTINDVEYIVEYCTEYDDMFDATSYYVLLIADGNVKYCLSNSTVEIDIDNFDIEKGVQLADEKIKAIAEYRKQKKADEEKKEIETQKRDHYLAHNMRHDSILMETGYDWYDQ